MDEDTATPKRALDSDYGSDEEDPSIARKVDVRRQSLGHVTSLCETLLNARPDSWTPATVAATTQQLVARVDFSHAHINADWRLLHDGPALALYTTAEMMAARTAMQALADAAHRELRNEPGSPSLQAALGTLCDFVARHAALSSTLLAPDSRPLSDPFTQAAGERLVRLYEVGRVLGSGTGRGSGTVYACTNRVTHQPVAAKLSPGSRYEIAINKLLTDAHAAGRAHMLQNVMRAVDYAFVRLSYGQWPGATTSAEPADYAVLVMEPAVCSLSAAILDLRQIPVDMRPINFATAEEMAQVVRAALCQIMCQLHALAQMFPEGFAHNDMRDENVLLVAVPEGARAHVEYRVGDLVLQIPTPRFVARISDFGAAGAIYYGVHPDNKSSAVRMNMEGPSPSAQYIREDLRQFMASIRYSWAGLRGNNGRLRAGPLLPEMLTKMERTLEKLPRKLLSTQIVPALFAAHPEACARYVLADAPAPVATPTVEPYVTMLIHAQHEYI